jgi:zinc and cadmium transporter
MLFEILTSSFLIALLSFVGLITLYFKHETMQKYLWVLIALASGTLLATAFFHLIPEAFEHNASQFILVGVLISYIIESVLHWHHCRGECKKHIKPYGYLNLLGDGIHNFIDGIVLGAAYLVNVELGIVTTLAIIAHEIPQELSDFGILLKSGFNRKKALMMNFITASTVIIGALVSFYFAQAHEAIFPLIGIAAGNFIYLALSDLIPELHKETTTKRTIIKLIIILLGIALIYLMTGIATHVH